MPKVKSRIVADDDVDVEQFERSKKESKARPRVNQTAGSSLRAESRSRDGVRAQRQHHFVATAMHETGGEPVSRSWDTYAEEIRVFGISKLRLDSQAGAQEVFLVLDPAENDDGGYIGTKETCSTVYKAPVSFISGPGIKLFCSCSPGQLENAQGFDMSAMTEEEATENECRHCSAIRAINSDDTLPLMSYPKTVDEVSFESSPAVQIHRSNPLLISVALPFHPTEDPQQIGIISATKNGILQCTSKGCRSKCRHVDALVEELGVNDELWSSLSCFSLPLSYRTRVRDGEERRQDPSPSQSHQAISDYSIPPRYVNNTMLNRDRSIEFKPPCSDCGARKSSCNHLFDPSPHSLCTCGSDWCLVLAQKDATLTSHSHTKLVDVYDWACKGQGKCRMNYKGLEDGLFRLQQHRIFTIECGQKFWETDLPHSHATFAAHHRRMEEDHARNQSPLPCPSRQVVWTFLWSFFNVLNVDYKSFGCKCCKNLPDEEQVVILDALACGVVEHRADVKPPKQPLGVEVGDFSLRVFNVLQDDSFRSRLKRWCGYGPKSSRKSDQWSSTLLNELLSMGGEETTKRLLQDLLASMKEWCQSRGSSVKPPGPFKHLISALACDYPIKGLVTDLSSTDGDDVDGTPLMLAVKNACSDLAARATLKRLCPVVFDLMVKCKWTAVALPSPIIRIMKAIQQVIIDSKAGSIAWYRDESGSLAIDDFTMDVLNADWLSYEERTAVSPAFTPCRYPGRYKADQSSQFRGLPCTKHKLTHPDFTPGFLLMFCPHGFCIGIKMMGQSEGPKTVFDWIYTRFKKAPKMIVYDNACNLHRYCLKRRPIFFAKTIFVIDRLHWFGHINCHEGYNIERLDSEMIVVAEQVVDGVIFPKIQIKSSSKRNSLNTQVAEQTNSKLSAIRTQVYHMLQENALKFIRYFLLKKNDQILANLPRSPLV